MGNIRHKWMVLMVVMVTTLATAHEAVKQYDGFREQANEWASSTLLASLLNTSAPVEELHQAQPLYASATTTLCSAGERADDTLRQAATLTINQLTKSTRVQQPADEAIHLAINEIPAAINTQHVEPSEADGESLEHTDEVALLTEKNHDVELEALGQLEGTTQDIEAAQDADEDSIIHEQREMHFINRVIEDAAPTRASEMELAAVRARAALEARVQARASRRALRVLQEGAGRSLKLELKLIKKNDRTSGGAGAAATPLRAANSAGQIKTADALEADADGSPSPHALQEIASTSQTSACASE